ncbi:MAG: BREX-6 system BrxE protein [Planctomycetota bacterium]|nr:BREX-6 system BrxE protein [Planctomycetota bacterium]
MPAQAVQPPPIPTSVVDQLLTAQVAIAWAGESGDEKRLGWWKSNLTNEFGGLDLFQRMFPHTWEWAVLQAVREVARRKDAELRGLDHDPDRVVSLYSVSFEIDERADERLLDLKRSGTPPLEALPGLREVIDGEGNREKFGDWVQEHGTARFVKEPVGRRLQGKPPEAVDLLVRQLVGACWPLAETFPMPHFRRGT